VNPAFYRGQLYLAFDTNDTALTRTGDFDVFLGVADLNTLELSPITQMSSKENVGEDINPQMAIFNDTLYFAWESSDDVLTLGNDLDLVVTTYNGTSWSTPYDFVRDEIVPTIDYAPHFVVWGDALHMYWIVDVRPPDGLAKDQRIATRLIARGPRWWDGLTATYEFAAPPRHGEPTTARVTVRDATGEPVVSPHFTFLFPNGSWAAINGSGSVISVDYVHNSTPVDPFIVRACGKALPLSAAGQDRVPGGPSVSGFDALPTAIALAGLAAALAARSAARRPR
jgi:hypothetical protein